MKNLLNFLIKWVPKTLFVMFIFFIIYIIGSKVFSDVIQQKRSEIIQKRIENNNKEIDKIDHIKEIPESDKIQLRIMKEALNNQSEDIARTIDLLNLIIVAGGGVVAILALVVTFQIKKWEDVEKQITKLEKLEEKVNRRLNDMEKQVNDNVIGLDQKVLKQMDDYSNSFEMRIKGLDSATEEYFNKVDDFFTRYSRGLSKYYSHNYSSASLELLNVADKYNSNIFNLADVHFHTGNSYYRLVDTSKKLLDLKDKENLLKSIKHYKLALNLYNPEDKHDMSNLCALIGISNAYLLNTFELTVIDEIDFKAHAISNAKKSISLMKDYITEQNKDSDFVLPSLYNVACIYSILYRFEKKDTELKKEFINKATGYLKSVYDKNLVRRDYILNDQDWKHIVDPERYDVPKEAKDELVGVIGQFFKKKYSRFEIAKLYMRIYESLTKEDFDKDLFKKKAIERLKRSYDSGLVSQNQVKNSAFQYSSDLFEFVFTKDNGEYEMIDKVNKNNKDKYGKTFIDLNYSNSNNEKTRKRKN